jgi:flagellar biogenesis protein FliO
MSLFFVLVLALVLLASYCIVKMCEGHQAERDEVESLEKDFIRPKN